MAEFYKFIPFKLVIPLILLILVGGVGCQIKTPADENIVSQKTFSKVDLQADYEVFKGIGEESGGSFACTDGSQSTTLPNTKLQYRGATMLWEVAVEGMTPARGIMPDHLVVPSVQEYISHKDVVLEFAVKLITQ